MILGILVTLVVLFAYSILRLFLTRLTHRSFNHVIPYLRPVGEEFLQEIMNWRVEAYLARRLSHKEFREEQQGRMLVADELIGHRAHNAAIFQGWGDIELRRGRITGEEELKAAARALVAACSDFRIGASHVRFQLHVWQFKLILLPFVRVPRISSLRKVDFFDVFASYEKIEKAALKLAEACGSDYYDRLLEVM